MLDVCEAHFQTENGPSGYDNITDVSKQHAKSDCARYARRRIASKIIKIGNDSVNMLVASQ
jgi:hypothetical protein